jgi:E1-E2 ATPase
VLRDPSGGHTARLVSADRDLTALEAIEPLERKLDPTVPHSSSPSAVVGAAATLVGWFTAGETASFVIERLVTVLVIACPHALDLAIPLVMAISTTIGARNGLLVRDRRGLEDARNVTAVFFDKTGTLTRGEFRGVEMTTRAGLGQGEALALAAAVERDSEPTIARGSSSWSTGGVNDPPSTLTSRVQDFRHAGRLHRRRPRLGPTSRRRVEPAPRSRRHSLTRRLRRSPRSVGSTPCAPADGGRVHGRFRVSWSGLASVSSTPPRTSEAPRPASSELVCHGSSTASARFRSRLTDRVQLSNGCRPECTVQEGCELVTRER